MDSDKKRIILRILLFLFILGTGLYFGIRVGEGQYNFYKPESPYYQKAVRDAQNDGYSEGWNAGRKDKQEKDYNSGWSAGYEFCLNENKTIRNNYDEGYEMVTIAVSAMVTQKATETVFLKPHQIKPPSKW